MKPMHDSFLESFIPCLHYHQQFMASSHFSMPIDDPQSSSNSPSWIWKPADHPRTTKENDDDVDESWEVRAFEEDARSCLMMGGTWPPRSYPCTFCRREFRSAQALGGHMNIHRRDRARLRHFSSVSDYSTGPAYLSTSVIPSAPCHSSSTISDRSLCSTEHQMFEIPRSNAEAAGPLLKSYHMVQDQSFGTDLDQPEEMPSDDVPFGVDLELRLGH